jgi:hypothetical protein
MSYPSNRLSPRRDFKGLSYLPRLRASDVRVREIASSGHFLFYDNPVETFRAVGEFVHMPHANSAV